MQAAFTRESAKNSIDAPDLLFLFLDSFILPG
jgi:hypothetical protein